MRVCDPLLPVLANDFQSTLAGAASTSTGFAIAYGGLQIVYGPLGDRLGRLSVIAVALAIAASALSALAPTLDLLVAARIATGAFTAAVIPLSLAWVGDNFSLAERQPVLARYLIGQMLGVTAGQIGGGVFADVLGWRAAFWAIMLLFGAGAALLWRPALQERQSRRPEPGRGLIAQTRALFADRWSALVLSVTALEGFLLFGAVTLVASYLQHDFGVSPSIAGTVSALFGLGGIVYALNARRLVGRLRGHGLARAGGVAIVSALLLLIVLPAWPLAIVATLLVGLGYYMLHNTLQTQATQLAPAARGAALAIFATVLWMGQGLGVFLAAGASERFGYPAVFTASGAGLAAIAWVFSRALKVRERADATQAHAAR